LENANKEKLEKTNEKNKELLAKFQGLITNYEIQIEELKRQKDESEKKNTVAAKVQNEPEIPPLQPTASKPPKYRIAGELFNTYVIIELYEKVLIIDKHAAHERIIFEEMRRTHRSGKIYAQMALVPVEIKLNSEEYAALVEYRDDITATGFEFEADSDGQTVRIVQYPADFDIRYVGEILLTMADRLAKGSGSAEITRRQNYEKAMYQASCKAAIKAGEINAPEQIRWLCDKLLVLPDIKYCPHGRPVTIELSKYEIEKKFKRVL